MTRAGASVLGELPAAALPAIVLPLDLSDQHRNAAHLVDKGAAIALSSHELDRLEATVLRLLDDQSEREAMAGAMRRLARPEAAERLATMLREMAA